MYGTKKISVAMATYNGEKYIEKQLLSICNQTLKPDEIVISDDGSQDDTLRIIQEISYLPLAKDIEFILLRNCGRHGCCGNFENALKHVTGDYIFLADQDDIWFDNKVECVAKIFGGGI